MSIWDTIAAPLIAIVNKVIPDKAAAAAAAAQLQSMLAQGQLDEEMQQLKAVTSDQSDVNKVEAANVNIFIAGWRPYVGWICGTALGLQFIVGPLFTWLTALAGHPTPFPTIDNPTLDYILGGMLGLGHITRTVEKVKGVVGQH